MANNTHKVWHKFQKWLIKKYGRDYNSKLYGYDVMCDIEKYLGENCKEIKILSCDDDIHSSSMLLLIPHPTMGITIMFIPQLSQVKNEFFIYEGECQELIRELTIMETKVYTETE